METDPWRTSFVVTYKRYRAWSPVYGGRPTFNKTPTQCSDVHGLEKYWRTVWRLAIRRTTYTTHTAINSIRFHQKVCTESCTSSDYFSQKSKPLSTETHCGTDTSQRLLVLDEKLLSKHYLSFTHQMHPTQPKKPRIHHCEDLDEVKSTFCGSEFDLVSQFVHKVNALQKLEPSHPFWRLTDKG